MNKIIALIISLLPILSIYKSPIPKVDLGTFIICMAIIVIVLYLKKEKKIIIFSKGKTINYLLLYSLYIILGFLIIFLTNQFNISIVTVIERIMKFILIIAFIALCSNNKLFDYKVLFKSLEKIAIMSCIMIIVQTMLFYIAKINIYGVYMPFILQGDYKYIDYNSMSLQYLYRPCAFFLEPAGLAGYLMLYLAILLYGKPDKRKLFLGIFVTCCMILSTSGQSFLYCGILWSIFSFKFLKNYLTKTSLLLIVISILIIPIAFRYIYSSEIVYKAVQRIINGESSGGNAVIARTFSFNNYMSLTNLNKIFGMGYGNPLPNVYFSSMSYTMYCTGVLGLIIILDFFRKMLKIYENKGLIICWFISTLISTTFVASSIAFYYPYIIEQNIEIKDVK